MGFLYIDESIHAREGIIVIAAVYANEDMTPVLNNMMVAAGLDPERTEYKSSVNYANNLAMANLRERLKTLFNGGVKIGVAIIPADQRKSIAFEALKAAEQFIVHNKLTLPVEVFMDQGMTKNNDAIREFMGTLKPGIRVHLEQDSKSLKGIQLADLAAHCTAIKFKCDMGINNKVVKVKDDDIYEEMELGFEMFATLRYAFFVNPENSSSDQSQHIAADLSVFPHGLYLSELSDETFNEDVMAVFGKIYLGCIH